MATASGSVGLFLSSSFKEKTYIALFKRNAALGFEGCVLIRVLAGVLEVEGHLFTPSLIYHPLISPMTNSRIVLTCLPPEVNHPDLTNVPVMERHLTAADMDSVGVRLDLCEADIVLLNQFLCSSGGHLYAVVLLRELESTLVDALNTHFFSAGLVFPSKEKFLKNFRVMEGLSKSLTVPNSYRQLVSDITTSSCKTSSEPIVLVCGKKNTGKSTLCRIIANSILNSHDRVMFLECDVGQAEFTVPGVISLHCVTKPFFGPAYTHLMQPEKAFFFGDSSPKLLPNFYIRLIRECMDYYHSNFSGVPLIVNTCGYTSGLGVPLFLDVTRIIKPSHIIQLHMHATTGDELPVLTPAYLASAEGLSLQSNQAAQQQLIVKDIGLFSNVNTKALYASRKRASRPGSPILISSDSEFSDSGSTDDEGDKRVETESNDNPAKRCSNESSHVPSSKVSKVDESGGGTVDGKKGMVSEKEWFPGLHCNVCVVSVTRIAPVYTRARYFRLLSYVAHFSPLLNSLSRTSSTEEMRRNYIMAATPYQVPWSAVAVHCIHRKVPSNQLLYALNGMFVALGRVSSEEIVDYGHQYHGITKFLKSSLPLVEFLGLGESVNVIGCVVWRCVSSEWN